jgi:hypothetical protein
MRTCGGCTYLGCASNYIFVSGFNAILDAGGDPNIAQPGKTSSSLSVLMSAMGYRKQYVDLVPVVNLFLQHGLDPNRDESQFHPLLSITIGFCYYNEAIATNAAQLLVQAGANPFKRYLGGMNILMFNGASACTQEILDAIGFANTDKAF